MTKNNWCQGFCTFCGTSCEQYCEDIQRLKKDLEEECRINGMGAQRELKLITERDRLEKELDDFAEESEKVADLCAKYFEALALMADGEGDDPTTYRQMAKAALKGKNISGQCAQAAKDE